MVMILTDAERARFIQWLDRQIATSKHIIVALESKNLPVRHGAQEAGQCAKSE
jgi:hypothetical protein